MTCSRVGSRYPMRTGMGGLHCDCCPNDSRKRTGRKTRRPSSHQTTWGSGLLPSAFEIAVLRDLVQQDQVQAAAVESRAAMLFGGSRCSAIGAMLRHVI